MGFSDGAVVASLRFFERHGGDCDCEILWNVATGDEHGDDWDGPDDGPPSPPAPSTDHDEIDRMLKGLRGDDRLVRVGRDR
jgi:hypothetical protein